MVSQDRLIEWDAHPRRSAAAIVDDRILTSCAAVRARMDGWWAFATGGNHAVRVFGKEPTSEIPSALTPNTVLMDRSHDLPAAEATAGS